ncbi:MAG: hypothetical protein AAFY60_14145, partial [Myxococcota bacterium]
SLGTEVIAPGVDFRERYGAVEFTIRAAPAATENDSSLVTLVRYREFSAAFAGDISEVREARIPWPKLSVLLAPHHGSKTSSSELMLRASSPELVVLSVGRHNRYHMPHPSVLRRLRAYRVRMLRTDEDGGVFIESDGHSWRARTRAKRFRGAN